MSRPSDANGTGVVSHSIGCRAGAAEEAGRDDLQHKAERGQYASRSPDQQAAISAVDAQVDSGALDGGAQPGKKLRRERNGLFENQGAVDEGRRNERERNSRRVGFLTPQACPESDIDNRLDGFNVREEFGSGEVPGVIGMDPQGRHSGSGISRMCHSRKAILNLVSNMLMKGRNVTGRR